MFVQTDLNFAPDVLRSVSVKNFKKKRRCACGFRRSAQTSKYFSYQFLWKIKLLLYFHVAEKKMSKGVGFEWLASVTVQIPFLPVIRIY